MNAMSEFGRAHQVSIEHSLNPIGDLRGGRDDIATLWAEFEKNAGVYVFIDVETGTVRYIGKSDRDLGGRVYRWTFKENALNSVLTDGDAILVASLQDHPYMASSFETWLIDELEPTHNKSLNRARAA